jgi:hypothetical protein
LQSAFGLWHNSYIANGCFYHDFFAATIVAALSLRDDGGGARYCNILALSSLVNNHYATDR